MSELKPVDRFVIADYVTLPKVETVPWAFKEMAEGIPKSEPLRPAEYFSYHFERQALKYGSPILERHFLLRDHEVRIVPLSVNEDFFASILGDTKNNETVYHEYEQQFYWRDPKSRFYIPVNQAQLKLSLSQWFIKCISAMGRSVDITQIFTTFRQDDVLDRIVERAKAVLRVEDEYFSKDGPNVRNPVKVPKEGLRLFADQHLTLDEPAVLTVREAYAAYAAFCLGKSLPKLHLNQFKVALAPIIRGKFDKGIRNDLDRYGGERNLGWRGIALRGMDAFQTEAADMVTDECQPPTAQPTKKAKHPRARTPRSETLPTASPQIMDDNSLALLQKQIAWLDDPLRDRSLYPTYPGNDER
jgi:hypothetical protein